MIAITKRHCTALRQDGEPCRAWAVRHSVARGKPLCVAHGGSARPLPAAGERGQPAVWDLPHDPDGPWPSPAQDPAPLVLDPGEEALPWDRGLYDAGFDEEEFAIVRACGHENSPQAEIALVRVVLRRLFVDWKPGDLAGDGEAMERRALILFKGAEVVGQLLQIQHYLQNDGDGLHPDIGAALDALGDELGLAL